MILQFLHLVTLLLLPRSLGSSTNGIAEEPPGHLVLLQCWRRLRLKSLARLVDPINTLKRDRHSAVRRRNCGWKGVAGGGGSCWKCGSHLTSMLCYAPCFNNRKLFHLLCELSSESGSSDIALLSSGCIAPTHILVLPLSLLLYRCCRDRCWIWVTAL